jgi:hypothetical protein
MLSSAVDHYERQQGITAAALVAARRFRWTDALSIAQIVALFQARAAQDALDSIDPMLEEQGISAPLAGLIAASSFAGTASDGRPLVSLLDQARDAAAMALMVVTQVQDAARQAAGVSIAARPHIGYVRMLNPPSCGRCVILAGKFFRYNEGFMRHPKCDCRHVPALEDTGDDLRTDPRAYFNSLDADEQAKVAGSQANAEAVRQGADLGQIVNAYRRTAGMQVAGVPAIKTLRGDKYTTEGTTRRAMAAKQQTALRRNGPLQLRLMPESIFAIAKDREDTQRLLRLYGWIRDDAAMSRGAAILTEQRRVERNARARQRRTERRKA